MPLRLKDTAQLGGYDISNSAHTHNYAGSSSAGGAATSANKLNTNAGDSNTPVYFSNGVPVACTSLDLNTSGSANSATYASRLNTQGNHTETASGTTANSPTAGMLYNSGMYMTQTYNDSNTPPNFGNIINLAGTGTGQLLCEWSGADNTTGKLYYRSHRDMSTGGWGPWKTVAYTDSNITGSSASCTGNAATATKLATARTINLGGFESGSASFNGTGDITINDYGYSYSKYVTTDSMTNPYVRIAYSPTITYSWYDGSAIFLVDSGHTGGGWGILKVCLRTNEIATAGSSSAVIQWLARYGFTTDQFILKMNSVANSTYVDLYFKAKNYYDAVNIRMLSGGGRGSIGRPWTFDNTAARAAADIRAYTSTKESSDVGHVNTANSAAACTGNAATATTATSATSATTATKLSIQNASNKDFNTLKSHGVYYGYTGMTNAAWTNQISVLEVIPYSNDWVVQRQTFINNSPRVAERHYHSGNTWSQWYTYYTTANKPTYSDVGAAAASHNHSAANITSGTLSVDRIPSLAASKITSGTFSADRIPTMSPSKCSITSGTAAPSSTGTAGAIYIQYA